jgi:hypothetical protein
MENARRDNAAYLRLTRIVTFVFVTALLQVSEVSVFFRNLRNSIDMWSRYKDDSYWASPCHSFVNNRTVWRHNVWLQDPAVLTRHHVENDCIAAQWELYVPLSLTFHNSASCRQSVFMCFVWFWKYTDIVTTNCCFLWGTEWIVSF